MSGAIGSVQLRKLSSFVDNRRKNAKIFKKLFKNEDNIITQLETQRSSWFGFSLILTNSLSGHRNSLVDTLIKNNIECRPIVAGNFTKNPVIKFLDYEICGDLNVSDEIDQNGFFVGNDFRDLSNEINCLYRLIKDFEQNI